MRVHSVEKIKELKRLRGRGYSITELMARLSIPKTTVWHHIQGVKVLPKYISILESKKRSGSTRLKEANWEKAQTYACELLRGPHREFAIAMAMLYWGEGSKKRCEFVNSDGRIIQLYLLALRKVFNIPEKDIRPTMRIFSGMNRSKCLDYWSRITKIPPHKFIIRLNDGSTRGRTEYGMCRIIISRGGNLLKLIKSLINQFFKELIIKY